MTDVRVRELERAAAGGDVDAAARLMLERVRTGTLERSGVEMAAYLGDRVAQLAVGAPDDQPKTVRQLLGRLAWWGREHLIVAGRLLLSAELQRWSDSVSAREPHEAINAALEWAGCPCLTHARACERAAAASRGYQRPWTATVMGVQLRGMRVYRGSVQGTAASLAELSFADHPDELEEPPRIRTVVENLVAYHPAYRWRRSAAAKATMLRQGTLVSELRLWALGLRSIDAFRV